MAEVLALRLLGVRVDVTTIDASLADALASAWVDCRDDRGPADTAVSIDPGVWGVDAETALEVASQLLVIEAVGAHAGSLLMLHAAVVADPDSGSATLLVGPSGRGKTTAAQALAGSRIYVSDETAGVTEGGRVLAFPKPLSVKGSGAAKRQVPASSLGRVAAVGEDFPVGAVLLLERDPAVVTPTVEPVPLVQAVALLAEHTSYLAALPQPLQRIAALLEHAGGLHRVRYAEATSLDEELRRWLRSERDRWLRSERSERLETTPAPDVVSRRALSSPSSTTADRWLRSERSERLETTTGFHRTPTLDEIVDGTERAVMLHDGQVLALGPVASLLVELGTTPCDVAEAAACLVEEFGPPPGDPSALVTTETAINSLVDLGVLVRVSPSSKPEAADRG